MDFPSSSAGIRRTITLVLVVVGFILLALGGYLNPLTRATLNPIMAAQTWISTRYMALHDFLTVPRDIASLRARNAELENEVSLLQAQVIDLEQQMREAQVASALLGWARTRPQNQYIAAEVIGRDPSPYLHYIFINQGSDNGIRRGMPVVTENGLVGRVDAINAVGARIQLVTDPSSAVNIRLETAETEAILTGSLTGEISLQMIPQETELQKGDIVLTSGLGGNFPQNLVVGQVVNIQQPQGTLFQEADIQPAVDFSSLKVVLVITNFKPVDITPLIPTAVP
jgi:rod shape-determining protein MreC